MSPDPPREDTGDDEDQIRRFSGEFVEGILNDEEFFIVPDAPYELDMEEESEYSDDSGDEGGATGSNAQRQRHPRTPHNSVTVEGEEQEFMFGEGQARGRYRLLIPFPTATVVEVEGETESEATGAGAQATAQEDVSDASGATDNNAVTSGDNLATATDMEVELADAEKQSTSSADCRKREIEMSEEKVEKIKEVMKNITLPPTAIPKWASEIDEESWKRKLNESISNGGRLPSKSDKCEPSSEAT